MVRVVDPTQGMDSENQAVLAGAPRSRNNIRENTSRNAREARKRKDKFFVPTEQIPKGYSVEWKRKSVIGKPEDPEYQMELNDVGWKFATPQMFPSLVPEGFQGNTIERGGMVLMIRPAHMTKEAHKFDREDALNQVRDKLAEIGMTGQGEAPRKAFNFDRAYDRPAARMIPEDDGSDYEGEVE